jgi:tetratricopeptide (TPR) repeat protein
VKKAQAIAKPFNDKKAIKGGIAAEKKLAELVKIAKDRDYGELKKQLINLERMTRNMQKAVMEPLLESLETIERRMKAYAKALNDGGGSLDDMNQSQDELQFSSGSLNVLNLETDDEGDAFGVNCGEEENGGIDVEELEGGDLSEGEEQPGMTAKQIKFFERLGHFFDVHKVADERAALVDPAGKIANLKVKSHSKGIQERDGTYKSGYQQQDSNGQTIRHLSDLYVAAEAASPAFQKIISSLGADVSGLDSVVAPLKPRARASEKAQEEYGYRIPGPGEAWLYDILRASVTCKTFKQLADVNRWLKENVHIVEAENRFFTPQFDGYRDILYHISVPYKDELAHICEIQVHHREFKAHFGVNSHLVYFRPYFAGPWRSGVENLRDLEMLMTVGRVDDDFMAFLLEATDPDQLKLFGAIFFEKLDETDKPLEIFKRVLIMEEASLGRGDVKTASTYQSIGLILAQKGDSDGALMYMREAQQVAMSCLGKEHPQVAVILSGTGKVLSSKGDYGEALNEHKAALAIREESLGEDHLLVAESHLNVAQALCDKGDSKHAMAECRTALIIQESILGERHRGVTSTHTMIGNIWAKQGEYAKAIDSYQTALSIREEVLGKKHALVADSLTDIGSALFLDGEYDSSEANHRKALHIRETVLGKDHPDCATSYSNIGFILNKIGDPEGALLILRQALKIRVAALGKNQLLTSTSYADTGRLRAEHGDFEKGLAEYKEALSIRKSLFGKSHPLTADIINSIGSVKTMQGDFTGALSEHRSALTILEKVVGSNHPKVADTYQYMAEAYIAKNDTTKALECHSKALGIRSTVLGKHHPDTASSCRVIASLLESKGDYAGAKMAYRQALAASQSLHGEKHPETAMSRLRLGHALSLNQEFDAAEDEFRKATQAREETLGETDLLTAEAYAYLGSVLSRKGQFDEALTQHRKALTIRKEELGEDHPDVLASKSGIEAALKGTFEDEMSL